eukprot:CAMPEP_0197028986 /NCGR_PEP_ID=MMETSP1384-20130603/8539_1 /TAXON_ID=29189 /ORGANISM="Ammonia sp." /LENGTH=500 /DNA_ID=CAMNT_0042458073 /DNA_START=108 /DNA_END=1610 /DNA_ORIENTATION=+
MGNIFPFTAFWLLPHVICVLWCAFNTVAYYRRRSEEFVQKRILPLTLLCTLCVCMILAAFNTIALLFVPQASLYWHKCALILFSASNFVLLLLFNITNWMIYLKSMWRTHSIQLQWIELLNTRENLTVKTKRDKTESGNYFILNKKRYGSLPFVAKSLAVFHFIGMLLSAYCIWMLCDYISRQQQRAIISMIACIWAINLIFVSFYFFISLQTPDFSDMFFVHWESKQIAKLYFVDVPANVLLTLIMLLLFVFAPDDRFVVQQLLCVMYTSYTMRYCGSHFIVSQVTVSKLHQKEANKSGTRPAPHLAEDDIVLHDILSDNNNIAVFMKYLSREFSVEILMAFIELIQFKEIALDVFDEGDGDEKLRALTSWTNLPSSIPLSEINDTEQSEDELVDLKCKASLLCAKYIKAGSFFEVNISYTQRMSIQRALDKTQLTASQLFALFDDVLNELFFLMSISLTRFRFEPEFTEIRLLRPDESSSIRQQQKQVVMDRLKDVFL